MNPGRSIIAAAKSTPIYRRKMNGKCAVPTANSLWDKRVDV